MGAISEVDGDILRHLTEAELFDLIELYKNNGDKYHYVSIYNHCRWNRQLEKKVDDNINGKSKWKSLRKTYFTHRHGNLTKNGTYISLQWDKMLSIQFHTLEESLQELKECIAGTKLIEWQRGPYLTAIHINFVDEIVELIKTLGGAFDFEIPCSCFTLAQSIGLNVHVPSVPDGYELRPLQEEYANFIHSNWPHKEEASVDFIRGMIVFNKTLGIFRLKDAELVAWIFQNEFYGLGILQVIPEEQGKGFAKLLTRAMTKKIAMSDEKDITSFAVVDNVKSESILKKAGYQKECVTKWVKLKNI